jgi:hypothetical protein
MQAFERRCTAAHAPQAPALNYFRVSRLNTVHSLVTTLYFLSQWCIGVFKKKYIPIGFI